MLKLLYIITTAIAFTSNFVGVNTNYYLRLGMGLLWIIIWIIRSKGVIRIDKFMRYMIFPWIMIFLLTLVLWMVNRPDFFNMSFFTRMVSNVIYCLVPIINAYIGLEFFGKYVIDMFFYSLFSSIFINTVVVWQKFGTSLTLIYLKTLLFQEYRSGTALLDLAMGMEVQGATMALGIFFVYYLFYCEDEKPLKRNIYILLSLVGLYIGFKRVVLLSILLVIAILWVLRFKRVNIRKVILYTFIVFITISFCYIFVVKTDLISTIASYCNVNMMGRTNIYMSVSKLYTLSPLYFGMGFGYIAKYLFETTGFAVHSEILRMYIELGFWPFIGWIWYNIYYIPQRVVSTFGNEAGKVCITATVYTFSTYLVENTLGLYPLHYGMTLFTILYLSNLQDNRVIRYKINRL